MTGHRKNPRSAFTLVEGLVVALIGVVSVGLALAASWRVREAANAVGCENNLRLIGSACPNCCDANSGYLPPYNPRAAVSLPTDIDTPARPGDDGSALFFLIPY